MTNKDEEYFRVPQESMTDKNARGDTIEKREPVKFKNGVIYHG
jgi:hypothetical protein